MTHNPSLPTHSGDPAASPVAHTAPAPFEPIVGEAVQVTWNYVDPDPKTNPTKSSKYLTLAGQFVFGPAGSDAYIFVIFPNLSDKNKLMATGHQVGDPGWPVAVVPGVPYGAKGTKPTGRASYITIRELVGATPVSAGALPPVAPDPTPSPLGL